jgi:hypothetical protein
MATGVTTQHPFSENPYITLAEYKNAPTSIDYDNLVVGGNAQAQDAELNNAILRASSFMDEFLNQNLNASTQIENQRVRITGQGTIALHPNNSPIISLQSFSYGADPLSLVTIPDPSKVWFEDQQIIIPLASMGSTYSSQGPLAFGPYGAPRQQVYARYQYTSGYVNNLIASATAAASSMTVQTADGIVPGMTLRIYDGASSEKVIVANNYTYGSTTVPLTSALAYTHTSGVAFGNLPQTIKEACILITTAFLKVRGDRSLTMGITTQPSGNISGQQLYGAEIDMALQMLSLYKRMR